MMSLSFRSRSEAELLINAVRKVNGIRIIRKKRNRFSVIALSILNLSTKTRNKSSDTEKKNTLCTVSISYTAIEYVTGERKVNPKNIVSPIFVLFLAIESDFQSKKLYNVIATISSVNFLTFIEDLRTMLLFS
jgi:hypothetical protein